MGNECFLCQPMNDLLIDEEGIFFTMAGWGPIVEGYSLISCKLHLSAFVDLNESQMKEFKLYQEKVRKKLLKYYDKVFLTEHGKQPICSSDPERKEHCYHAHQLIFPGIDIAHKDIITNFSVVGKYENIKEIYSVARNMNSYFLISTNLSEYYLAESYKYDCSQAARHFVASLINKQHLIDWNKYPNKKEAKETAKRLSFLFEG